MPFYINNNNIFRIVAVWKVRQLKLIEIFQISRLYYSLKYDVSVFLCVAVDFCFWFSPTLFLPSPVRLSELKK